MSRRLILGTAGHIDHGKTTLVRALTGTDTDRLPEEKERGITIDLGFAELALDDGTHFGIVDVPGHESFIRNMMAGASGIDLLLLVVAADEGVMPQTREHVAIARLLGVRRGVIALTKSDLVEPAWLELVREEVGELLETTTLADAPVVPVSGVTGEGVPALLRELAGAAETVKPRSHDDLFRMPIDRAFTVRGTGTVVTGTVWSGRIPADATVRALPAGTSVRVRGIEVHGEGVDEAGAGQRAALAVAVERDDVPRGTVLVADDAWTATRRVTARLSLLPSTDWVVEHRQRVRFHLGTAEVMGRVVLLERERLEPGATGWAQLRLEAPVVARARDRFVVRSYSPVTTIGGGVVAEPAPARRKRLEPDDRRRLETVLDGAAEDAVRQLLAAAGRQGIAEPGLAMATGRPPHHLREALGALGDGSRRIGGRLFDADAVTELGRALLDAVTAFHRRRPLEPGMDRAELRRAAPPDTLEALVEHAIEQHLSSGALQALGSRVALAGYTPDLDDEQRRVRDRILAALTEADLAPPSVDELPPNLRDRPDLEPLLKLLEYERQLIPLTPELYLARQPFERAVERVRESLGGREGLSPTDFKVILPVSRKYLIPLLELLDREGVTARADAGRSVPVTPE